MTARTSMFFLEQLTLLGFGLADPSSGYFPKGIGGPLGEAPSCHFKCQATNLERG